MPREPISSGIADDALVCMVDPKHTALVVIDVQNDFAAPDCPMVGFGCDLASVEPTIDQIERLIVAARAAGATVAFIRLVTRAETDSKALKLFHQRQGYGEAVAICRADTSGADYYRVKPQPGDVEVEKLLYSGFVGTDFDAQLKGREIDTLVFTGLTTECCVDSTVRDAFHHDYNCFIADDATTAYGDDVHAAAMSGLTKNCALAVSTDAIAKAWKVEP